MDGANAADPLVLQAKEAQPSVLANYVEGAAPQDNQGERVVHGQRLIQMTSDIFLGWQRVGGIDGQDRDFYIRQLRDGKGSVVVEELDPAGMSFYGRLCGRTLARAHARSGIASRSAPTWVAPASSTRRSPTTPWRTPSRTPPTMRPCAQP
jgi:hypothetical protein